MSPATAIMTPSTRKDTPIPILIFSDTGRDGSIGYTSVSNYADHKISSNMTVS